VQAVIFLSCWRWNLSSRQHIQDKLSPSRSSESTPSGYPVQPSIFTMQSAMVYNFQHSQTKQMSPFHLQLRKVQQVWQFWNFVIFSRLSSCSRKLLVPDRYAIYTLETARRDPNPADALDHCQGQEEIWMLGSDSVFS